MLPEHCYPQTEITAAFAEVCRPAGDDADPATPANIRLMHRLHANCGVQSRHLALPVGDYRKLTDFTAANQEYLRIAVELAVEAVTGALADAGLAPGEVDVIFATTVTGLAVPSLDALIAARVGLRPATAAGPPAEHFRCPPLGVAPWRAQGDRGDRIRTGPPARCTRTHLAVAGRGGKYVLGLGAARPARHPDETVSGVRNAGQVDDDGSWILLRTRPVALVTPR